VAEVLRTLRKASAKQQVTILADRLPTAGMFHLFREQRATGIGSRLAGKHGSPTGPWGWEDLN